MSARDDLLYLLQQQRILLSQLLELIREERTCLLDGALDRIEEIVREQSTRLAKQATLSTRISALLQKVGAECHLTGRVSLARLVEASTADVHDGLDVLHQEITDLAWRVQQESKINWHLSQQALRYVEFTLRVIGNAVDGMPSYHPFARTATQRPLQVLVNSCA